MKPLATVLVLIVSRIGVADGGAINPGGDFILAGKSVYNSYCITCHGPNMVNFGTRAPDLRKFPLDQEERFFNSVKTGKGAMPAWGELLGETDLVALWEYVKSGGK